MQINYGLLPKGGAVRGNPKVLGHFLCTNHFGILGRKGEGGIDQIQKFASTFSQIFGELGHKKVPKKFQKNLTFAKVLKFQGGGWGQTYFRRSP